jgi:hypothetical protein
MKNPSPRYAKNDKYAEGDNFPLKTMTQLKKQILFHWFCIV